MNQRTQPSAPTDPDCLSGVASSIDSYLGACLDESEQPGNLREALAYALLGPGKRLRPALVIRSCEAVGGQADGAMAAAAAIEMIHCFSLIHDDLPAMDDDDLRRGRPTLHRHRGEAMAILAGDALMGLAFELILSRIQPADRAGAVARELARGTNAMIAGQVYDTLPRFDPELSPEQRLRTIHAHKTGALIQAATRIGGLCGGASDEQMQVLDAFGQAIGLMFQIVDDVLDVTATTEQLGKTAGKDAMQDKLTYPSVLGLEASRDEVRRLRERAHLALRGLGAQGRELGEICDYLAVRTH